MANKPSVVLLALDYLINYTKFNEKKDKLHIIKKNMLETD